MQEWHLVPKRLSDKMFDYFNTSQGLEIMLIIFFSFYWRSKPLIIWKLLQHLPIILFSTESSSCIVSMIWNTCLPSKGIFACVERNVNTFKWKCVLIDIFLADFFSCWLWHFNKTTGGLIFFLTLLFSCLCLSVFHLFVIYLLFLSSCQPLSSNLLFFKSRRWIAEAVGYFFRLTVGFVAWEKNLGLFFYFCF